MDKNEVIKYLKIERECISRDCDRNCGYCDLVQEQKTLLDAYDSAISLLSINQEDIDDNTKWNKEWIKWTSIHSIYYGGIAATFCAHAERN